MYPEREMGSREVPREVRELVDQLGQMFVQALVTDEASKDVLKQIQEHGFEVGIMVEATVALHSKHGEDGAGDDAEGVSGLPEAIRGLLEGHEKAEFEWSDEDRAMLCNFRISLD
jgi:hypothetical protein